MKKLLFTTAAILSFSNPAHAATFVGSWDVYDPAAPLWNDPTFAPTGPLAYTGLEAAALLFGGAASDYAISTVDGNVLNINNMAWYDQIGIGGGMFAENYSNKYLGQYYGPSNNTIPGAASAFIRDNLSGQNRINYAFRVDAIPAVPEPGTWVMLLVGFGFVGGAMRYHRRQQTQVHFAL